tara:strand:- start:35665 stop:35958 length:294 start_codon:yes stop_codon:yes gene_type:complete
VLYFIKKLREVIEMDKKIKVTEEIKKLSFEEAISELERIVEDLERGDIELEDSISIYERGVILKAHCEAKLKTAKMKIDKIVSHPDGDFSSEPLDEI